MPHARYIGRTRDSYFAQGYEKPHVWPHFAEVPFAPRAKPLAECRLALVSTSEIDFEDEDYANPTDEGRVGGVYAIPSPTPFERLCSHAWAYYRQATTLDDVNALFPLSRLQQMVPKGRIASLAPSCHGIYDTDSKHRTSEVDAPDVLRRCRDDAVYVVLLSPV